MLHSPDAVLLNIILPVLLVVLVNSKIALSIGRIPVTIIVRQRSSVARDICSSLCNSRCFRPVTIHSEGATRLLVRGQGMSTVLIVPRSFSTRIVHKRKGIRKVCCNISASMTVDVRDCMGSTVGL